MANKEIGKMSAEQFQRIRERDLKLSRSEFARIFGWTPRHVRNMENGVTDISRTTEILMKLAKIAVKHELVEFK